MTKDVTEAIKDYKKSDHLMMRKTFSMKDVLYRKNAPAKELWRSEVAFDVKFCLLAAGVVLAFMVFLCAMARVAGHMRCFARKLTRPRSR